MARTLSLSEVTNNYGTYRGNSLVGEKGTVATIPNDTLDGINGVDYPFLEGIIVRINGSSYTYSGWLNQAKLQGNPYVSKSSLPTLDFTLSDLTAPKEETIVYGSTTRTKYAEVNITKRMSSIDDILSYLNDFFNPNTSDTVLDPRVIGGWNLNTTTYNPDLDVVGEYPGLEFEQTYGTVLPSVPPTETTPRPVEPKPRVFAPRPKPVTVIKPPKPPKEVKTSTGIKVKTPTGTFTGTDQNFLLGDANKNTGNADVKDTIKQLEKKGGLAQAGLTSYMTDYSGMPLAAMFDDGNYDG